MKIINCINLLVRKILGKPYHFIFIKDDSKGTSVGEELSVVHPTFHNMAPYFCRCLLTEAVLLYDLKADAIKIISFRRIDDHTGETTFQPYLLL